MSESGRTMSASDVLAVVLCGAFFGALGVAIYLTPGWGELLGGWWVTPFEARQ